MKHILILICSLTLLLSGCKKFLESEPSNRLASEDVFADMEGARTVLSGCYERLRSSEWYIRDYYLYADIAGGNIKFARGTGQKLFPTYNFNNDPVENDYRGFYRTAYALIFTTNAIMEQTAAVADATPAQKGRLRAEALTFRALAHFDLVRMFAQPYGATADASHPGIVVKNVNVNPNTPLPPPSTVKEVYDHLYADLDSAIVLYSGTVSPYNNDKFWLSADAAKALLCRVALYRGDWAKSAAMATDLIASGNYTLTTNANYVNSWRNRTVSNEAIWDLAYGNAIGENIGAYYNPTLATTTTQWAATNDLLSAIPTGDVRDSSRMFIRGTVNGQPYYFTRKYQGTRDTANNIRLFRLSEVYLNRAEALAESGNLTGALADLNAIRRRARPTAPLFASSVPSLVIAEILAERRRELSFEGHLFFDIARRKSPLTRTDCSGARCSFTFPDADYAVPRPIL